MQGKKNQSALLAKYFNMYKKNPRSRVFAPLAESYRKLGMLEDAYKVLKDGIRNHPDYTLGYIVLAHCCYDEKKFELTYNTLRPIINKNADNISLQKIFAQACIHLGHLEEALDTFKYLLFMNPRDKFFAEQVKRLEDDLLVSNKKMSLEQLIKAPDMPILHKQSTFEDDWVQVDFNQPQKEISPKIILEEKPEAIEDDNQWIMEKQPTFAEHPILKEGQIKERGLEDDFYADEFGEEGDIDEVNEGSIATDSPIISHTLIDLYCAQHYYDKAIELLEKILELNPLDNATKDKLQKVFQMKHENQNVSPHSSEDEQAGHEELISIIENKVKMKSQKEIQIEKAFGKFLHQLKSKSEQHKYL